MIALIFATQQEARPFLALSQAEPCAAQPFQRFQTPLRPGLQIVISRIGKVAAAAACQAMIATHGAQRIVNAGACGLLADSLGLSVGQLVRITTAQEGDHEVFGKRPAPVPCENQIGADLPPTRLVTCDRPVFDHHRRNACSRLGDVVDMEGAAIARVATLNQIPCDMIKGISDIAGPTDRKTLLANLDWVSEVLGKWLWQRLK
jgi:nucleoside phosphorylase